VRTAEEKVRRVRRILLIGTAVWTVCSCCLFSVWYVFEIAVGALPLPGAYFDPTVTTYIPDPAPFDQAMWDRGRPADRIAMGKWFEAHNSLAGMRRAEVVAMLGPIEYEWESEGRLQLQWPLGKSDAGGWPLRWTLQIGFDRTGRVQEASVRGSD
jgi:hypothetical protein